MKKHEGLESQGVSRALCLSGCLPVPVYCGCGRDTENATGDVVFPPGFRTKWLPYGCPSWLGAWGMLAYRSSLTYETGSPHPFSPVPPISSPPHCTGTARCCLRLFAQAILQDSKCSTDHSLKMASIPHTLHVPLTLAFFLRWGLPT